MNPAKTLDALPLPAAAQALLPEAAAAASGLLVVGASLAIALCAQLAIPLPFSPVPLTGQTLGVLYAGALLGRRRGSAAVALYLLEGASGLPVFAHGAAGWPHLLGPTGGYLLGFLPAAWVAGALAERGWDSGPFRALAMMLAGSAAIFACGLAGLSFFAPKGRLLALGLYPFLAGDLAKSCLSAALLPPGRKLLDRLGRR